VQSVDYEGEWSVVNIVLSSLTAPAAVDGTIGGDVRLRQEEQQRERRGQEGEGEEDEQEEEKAGSARKALDKERQVHGVQLASQSNSNGAGDSGDGMQQQQQPRLVVGDVADRAHYEGSGASSALLWCLGRRGAGSRVVCEKSSYFFEDGRLASTVTFRTPKI
jgi:hypothetical protein